MTRTAQSKPRNATRPARSAAAGEAGFQVRWDRTVLAALALVAGLTFIGTGLAAAFGAGTLLIAGLAAVVAVGAVATLRVLAVRDRKKRADRRIEHAFDEAMSPTLAAADPVVSGAGSTPVFDAASGATGTDGTRSEDSAPSDRPASDSADQEDATPAASTGPDAAVLPSVPRPTYLDASEAHRPEPAPLVTPEVPKASPGVKLKSGVSSEYRAKLEATAHRTLDLDKVLERRRAV